MQKITVICVGKLGQEFLQKGCAEYIKRLGAFCDLKLVELPEELIREKAASASQITRALEKEGAFPFRRKLVGNKTVRYRNTDIYDYINAPDIQEKQTEGEAH